LTSFCPSVSVSPTAFSPRDRGPGEYRPGVVQMHDEAELTDLGSAVGAFGSP
jgi:hypothetical protein